MDTYDSAYEALKREWTDQFVQVVDSKSELARFRGLFGRVITVNRNNKAVIDFADGGWYDLPASPEWLIKVDAATAKAKFKDDANSAQPFPTKQG